MKLTNGNAQHEAIMRLIHFYNMNRPECTIEITDLCMKAAGGQFENMIMVRTLDSKNRVKSDQVIVAENGTECHIY